MGKNRRVDGNAVLEAAGECQALLDQGIGQDWTRKIPGMEWNVAQAVVHIAEGMLWYACDLAAGPRELETMDLRVRPETPPPDLVATIGSFATVLARVIDGAPTGARGWHPMGTANGRVDLPGQDRQTSWRWHCAPLDEWDGSHPRGRP